MPLVDHAANVLAGIVPDRTGNLLYALQHLEPVHFREDVRRNLYVLLDRYYDLAAEVMDKQGLIGLCDQQGIDVGRMVLYEELYDQVAAIEIEDHQFRYSVQMLKDLRAKQLTGEAITTAFEVLENGLDRGFGKNAEHLQGHKAAREYLYSELAGIDKVNTVETAPEGNMLDEGDEMLEEYATRKAASGNSGVNCGIDAIDRTTTGFQPGELIFFVAYTGEGKSHFATQTTWHAATQQGLNVFFATSETVRAQVRRRLISRHSRLPEFGLPEGLNAKDIKNTTLDSYGEKVYAHVIDDLKSNPDYGKIYISQVPRGATLSFLEARLQRQAQEWKVDLVVIDYIALLRAEIRRATEREEFTGIIRDAKMLATSFNQGEGVPILSPWQVSQTAWKDARTSGTYTLANLADTSEAEKSADVIMSLLRMEGTRDARIQFLKNRDGEIPDPIAVNLDYRCSYLGEIIDTGMEDYIG